MSGRQREAGIETARRTRLIEAQRQVSTGKRIDKPSDDPSATLGSIGEHNETAAIDQYARATDTVGSRLAVVDTVLSDLITKLTAAQVASASARGVEQDADSARRRCDRARRRFATRSSAT